VKVEPVEFVRRHPVQQFLHLRNVAVKIAGHVNVKTSILKPRPVCDRQRRQLTVWKRKVDERLDPVEDSGGGLSGHGDQFAVRVDRQ